MERWMDCKIDETPVITGWTRMIYFLVFITIISRSFFFFLVSSRCVSAYSFSSRETHDSIFPSTMLQVLVNKEKKKKYTFVLLQQIRE